MRAPTISLAVAFTLAAVPIQDAFADRHEAQWSARPMFGVARLREEKVSGSNNTAVAGMSLGASYGLSHGLDIGVELVGLGTAVGKFDEAILQLDGGLPKRTTLSRRSGTTMLMVGPTWRFGVQWVPVVSLAGGAGVRFRSAGRFGEFNFYPMERAVDRSLDLGASARMGIERRVNRRLTLGAYVDALASWSPSAPMLPAATFTLGVSYVHYPLW